MRIISFSHLWPKLTKEKFTTFRFQRKDKSLYPGEVVQIYYKSRSKKDSTILGLAEITKTELRWVANASDREMKHYGDRFAIRAVTQREAKLDGFESRESMVAFMREQYRCRHTSEPMVRTSLVWTQKWLYTPEQKPHVANEWAKLIQNEEAG